MEHILQRTAQHQTTRRLQTGSICRRSGSSWDGQKHAYIGNAGQPGAM